MISTIMISGINLITRYNLYPSYASADPCEAFNCARRASLLGRLRGGIVPVYVAKALRAGQDGKVRRRCKG